MPSWIDGALGHPRAGRNRFSYSHRLVLRGLAFGHEIMKHCTSCFLGLLGAIAIAGVSCTTARAADPDSLQTYRDTVQPFLQDYCFGCHGDGAKKGGISLDTFASDDALLGNTDLWWSALKNVRAGIMPPAGKPRPSAEEFRVLEDWVKRSILKIDLKDPDPGRATLRRLNRNEYRYTIRDLMGVDYNTDEEFPADDTGYGFDTIGDVLSVSPLLLEKYLQAAETIVEKAVPVISRVMPVESYPGSQFRGADRANGSRLSFYDKATVSRTIQIGSPGDRRLTVDLNVDGSFEFDPGRAAIVFKADGKEMLREEYKWQDNKNYHYEFPIQWEPGGHELTFEIEPLTPVSEKKSNILLRIVSVEAQGPLDPETWVRPKSFDRFFHADDPKTTEGRASYAREVLRRFASKAYRRPVDDRTVERLAGFAEEVYREPGVTVEAGIARAMVAVLTSPRFLFRVEEVQQGGDPRAHPLVDEYALASRLSYFLWSTMPDPELMELAAKGALRENLASQIKRMLDDERSDRMTKNFTGQWLQARDVETIAIDPRSILARDDGEEKELAKEQEEFRAFLAQREIDAKKAAEAKAKGESPPRQEFGSIRRSGRFRRLFAPPRVEFDDPLRQAMRRETELFFDAVVREDRSLLDLLDSDFTFLNERLAKHYGIPDVKGDYMRKVTLPPESPRGGLLTQGTVLVVTSNPTRTSPVKRGLFLLENILGTPPPPAPPSVPDLEESEKGFVDREPTLREVLTLHRSQPLCNACHSRMDPLGLGLENFNALGLWRDKERGQPLDTGGTLISGETFNDVRALKSILKENHRTDFYRCLTEKLLTYAIGRGVEPADVESVDRIVGRIEAEGGKFSALLHGIIESSPFQKRRKSVKEEVEGTGDPATAAGPGRTPPSGASP